MIADWFDSLNPWYGILVALAVAVIGHLLVRGVRRGAEGYLRAEGQSHEDFIRRYPKSASLITIGVSTLTFIVYFGAIGLILVKAGVNLGTYLATAGVVGLAVGFGLQGLVQDVIVGLTLIFSDVLDVGDMVEVSGQTGRVDRIGLRFTTVINFQQQEIYIPNRIIAAIGRYPRGYVRAFVDVQAPEEMSEERLTEIVQELATAMRAQHGAVIVAPPEIMGMRQAGDADRGGWRFLRIKFKLWPGQAPVVETGFRARVLAAIRAEVPDYPDWMIAVTLRAG